MQPNGEMLRLARQRKGFHQTEAASKLGIEQPVLSRIENGLSEADGSLLKRAVDVYEQPLSFFSLTDTVYGPPVSVHAMWRKKADVSARELDRLVAELNIRAMHLRRLLQGVELRTNADIPTLDVEEYGDVERIAALVRAHWRVPSGPIKDLSLLAERAGIVVVYSKLANSSISGVTFNVPGLPPTVMLNQEQPADRLRFTLAHEIGHLVMHRFPTSEMEKEANLFASALLMPEKDIRLAFQGRKIDLKLLGALKPEWRVAMQALHMRARSLKLLSEQQSLYIFKRFSALKIRLREPVQYDFPREEPTILPRVIEVHLKALGYTKIELAKLLHVNLVDMDKMYGLERPEGNKPRFTIIT